MNIITGLFVDQAIQSAKLESEAVIQANLKESSSAANALRKIFETAELDEKGTMDWSAFDKLNRNERTRAHLASLGLQVHEARGLFRLLDTRNLKRINLDAFILGCMKLKAGVNVATLMYENKKLMMKMNRIEKDIRQLHDVVLEQLGETN